MGNYSDGGLRNRSSALINANKTNHEKLLWRGKREERSTACAQGAPKNVPNGPANTEKTVETVKKLRDPDATPLKRSVNEIEPSFSSAPCVA